MPVSWILDDCLCMGAKPSSVVAPLSFWRQILNMFGLPPVSRHSAKPVVFSSCVWSAIPAAGWWSDVGAVLLQTEENGVERGIRFFSKKYEVNQKHYSVLTKSPLLLFGPFNILIFKFGQVLLWWFILTIIHPLCSLQNPNQRLLWWALYFVPLLGHDAWIVRLSLLPGLLGLVCIGSGCDTYNTLCAVMIKCDLISICCMFVFQQPQTQWAVCVCVPVPVQEPCNVLGLCCDNITGGENTGSAV